MNISRRVFELLHGHEIMMDGQTDVCLSKLVGIYCVDTSWVLALYSVVVQKKYPTNLRDLLGTYGDCWVL